LDFLVSYAGKFDMYVEDECAAYLRYCFADPMDAAIFRSRFDQKPSALGSRVEQAVGPFNEQILDGRQTCHAGHPN